MSDVSDIERRVSDLEKKYYESEGARRMLKVGAVVFGVIVLAWLGLTSFVQIPKSIELSLENKVTSEVTKRIEGLEKKAKKCIEEIENSKKAAEKSSEEMGNLKRRNEELFRENEEEIENKKDTTFNLLDDIVRDVENTQNEIVTKTTFEAFQREINNQLQNNRGLSVLKFNTKTNTPKTKLDNIKGASMLTLYEDIIKIDSKSIIIISTNASGIYQIRQGLYSTLISKIWINKDRCALDNSNFIGKRTSPEKAHLFTSCSAIKELKPGSYNLRVEAVFRGKFDKRNLKISMQYVIISKE
ncbi:MAG: hypothetical protein KAT34_06925 [Candidatus Aminicenantes bacterium]|nr:hypothetical protein [Candidatus Aminicenantes bacterium]